MWWITPVRMTICQLNRRSKFGFPISCRRVCIKKDIEFYKNIQFTKTIKINFNVGLNKWRNN